MKDWLRVISRIKNQISRKKLKRKKIFKMRKKAQEKLNYKMKSKDLNFKKIIKVRREKFLSKINYKSNIKAKNKIKFKKIKYKNKIKNNQSKILKIIKI